MIKRKQHHWREWCVFGNHKTLKEEGHVYIYPIPICEAYPKGGDPAEGAIACTRCAPAIQELQKEQGLVISASYGFTNGS